MLEKLDRPDEQVLVWGSIARAAGGLENTERFRSAAAQVIQLATRHEEHAAAALIHVGEGARALGWWEDARWAAEYGRAIAERRHEADPQRMAEDLLAAVVSQETPPGEATAENPAAVQELADQFRRRLARWR